MKNRKEFVSRCPNRAIILLKLSNIVISDVNLFFQNEEPSNTKTKKFHFLLLEIVRELKYVLGFYLFIIYYLLFIN
jgi:hypothetical protein